MGHLCSMLRDRFLVDARRTAQSGRPAVPHPRNRRTSRKNAGRTKPMSTSESGMLHRRPTARGAADIDREGFPVGPGSQMVSGLRGLRHPFASAERAATTGSPARKSRLRFRHRLLVAIPLLSQHLRNARHSRAGAGNRHGREMRESGIVRVGHHRRRRQPLDRHQSLDPLHAAQSGRQYPALEQPDLRPDQRAILADLRIRQENEVQPAGHHRAADPSDGDRAGRRRDLRRADGVRRPGAPRQR